MNELPDSNEPLTVYFNDRGHLAPVTVMPIPPDDMERILEALAEFLWNNRNAPHVEPDPSVEEVFFLSVAEFEEYQRERAKKQKVRPSK